jgi:hypothetical protein
LRKYFLNETIFDKNKEILRTELINYIKFFKKSEYLELFEWTYNFFKESINIDRQNTITIFANSFHHTSNTDMKWMTNVLTQPDSSQFSERDKVSYYFKVIDETLEGVFKPRFKLFDKLVRFKLDSTIIIDNSKTDFGKLIRDFPIEFENDVELFLKDPYHSIPTSQWRNIAAHKSYTINKNNIIVEYGRTNIQVQITFEEFYNIVHWTQDIYRVIRLAQVFTHLNYMEDIITELEGSENMNIRFESSLLHIIHNMQIVGFQFVSTEEEEDTFCLNLKGKVGHDIKSSLIHASQCLDQLSFAIHDDEFVRDNFRKTKINIVDKNLKKIASATISIEIALKHGKSEIDLGQYLDNMYFDIKEDPSV